MLGRWTSGRRKSDEDVGLWTLDVRRLTLGRWDVGTLGRWTFACLTLDVGRWMLDVGVRWTFVTLDAGRWTLDVGSWTLDVRMFDG